MANRKMANGKFGESGRRVWLWVGLATLILALGVVTNVGVAWWCVFRSVSIWGYSAPAPMYVSAGRGLPHLRWFGYERLEALYIEETSVWAKESKRSTPEYVLAPATAAFREIRSSADAPVGVQNTPIFLQGEFRAAGWPWLSVCSVSFLTGSPAGPQFVDRGGWWCDWLHADLEPIVGEWAIGIDPTTSPRRVIFPYRPLWPGFIANTLVYFVAWASVLVVLFAGTTGMRRVLRARRGQCRRCGYDRSGLASAAVCPECGKGA